MNKSLRQLSTLLVGVLAVGTIITACSSKTDKGSSPAPGSASPAASSEPSKAPDKKVPLSLFMYGEKVDGLNYNDNPIVNKVKELANVDLKVEAVSSADYAAKFGLLMASGNLPDLVNSNVTAYAQAVEAAQAGAFIDLKAYYDKSPIIQKYVTPEMMEMAKDPATGKYWRIPMAWDKAPKGSGIAVRYDLVEKYNNGVWPESVEQWVDLLRVIKKANPTKSVFANRNIGIMLFYAGGTPIFDMYGANPYGYRIVQGKLIPNVLLPEYRAAVKVMRQMYDEGILDKDFATTTSEQYLQKMDNDPILLNTFETSGITWNANYGATKLKDGRKFLFMHEMKKPPAELADMKYTYGFGGSKITSDGISIASSSKDPDRAWKVIEAFTSDELVNDIFWGEEGKTYSVKNGKKVPNIEALAKEWTRYSHYFAFVPGYLGAPDLDRAKTEISLGEQYAKELYASIDKHVEKVTANGEGSLDGWDTLGGMPGYVPTEAESLKKPESRQSIDKFTVKAIMGELSMEQLDQEVAKWEKEYRSVLYDNMQKFVDENKEKLRKLGYKQVDW